SICIVSEEMSKFLELTPTGSMQLRGAFNSRSNCPISTARICIVLGAFQIPVDVAIDSVGFLEKNSSFSMEPGANHGEEDDAYFVAVQTESLSAGTLAFSSFDELEEFSRHFSEYVKCRKRRK
ncbi:MAG: hypothetical protein K2J87_03915, partial [Muribaculaceae bacterium]|nr:hypothetical protein [Muribaculaceae bacterium]